MSKKTEEVKELVILTPEQIEKLPKQVQENVVFLTEKINPTDLMQLNPMVEELINLREQGRNLIFEGKDKDGNYNKTNIQDFVDVKKNVRSFRAKVKDTAKKLKVEPAKITKAIIAIEKTFVDEATKVYDGAEALFEEYIKWEEAEKQKKIDAKNKALIDAVEESKAKEEEIRIKMERTEVYNSIKYEGINAKINEAVTDALINANEERLVTLRKEIDELTWSELLNGKNHEIVDIDVLAELQEFFAQSKHKAVTMIDSKLKAIKIEKDNLTLQAKQEVVNSVPETKEPSVSDVSDEEFVKHIVEQGKSLLNLTIVRINSNPTCIPQIYDLRNLLSSFNNIKI